MVDDFKEFNYGLRKQLWQLPSILTRAGFGHSAKRLLQGNACFVPPSQVSFIGSLPEILSNHTPICIVKCSGDFVGSSVEEVARNIQVLIVRKVASW